MMVSSRDKNDGVNVIECTYAVCAASRCRD